MSSSLTLYPDLPAARTRVIVRDVAVVLLLAFFVWCGFKVHDVVDQLSSLALGVQEAGTSVQGGFASAAEAVDGVPLVGQPLGEALNAAGSGTGGNVASLGQSGADALHLLARTLGLATALLPAIVLLVVVVPRRLRGVREMSAARLVSAVDPIDPERRRLLAMRAAFGLPFRDLLPYTRDPFGDLVAGRYDALVAAALAEVGLRDRHASGQR